MKCPIDGATLVMTDRNGVEIDYCPTCRGVWLDRGELDKIIERSVVAPAPQAVSSVRGSGPSGDQGGSYKKRKRGGFLDELFDF